MGGDGDLRSGPVRGRETGAQRSTGVVEWWRDGVSEDGALEVWSAGTETAGAGATPYTTRERVAGADPELDRWKVGRVEFLF